MPVFLKVSLSKKRTRDFNSTCYGLEIASELPVGSDPNAMAQASDELFRLAEDLIQAQIDQTEQASPSPAYSRPASRSANGNAVRGNENGQATANSFRRGGTRAYAGTTGGNGNGNGHGNGSARPGVPGITDAQARAIEAIAKRMNCDADRLSQDELGVNVPDLSVRQASELIDILKKQLQASEQGGRR